MKYVKKFENTNNEFLWLILYIEEDNIQPYLFSNKESAENWWIHLINDDRKQMVGHNYNDKMIFTDLNEAVFWYQNNINIKITMQKINLIKQFEGSNDMIRMRDIKKYNL